MRTLQRLQLALALTLVLMTSALGQDGESAAVLAVMDRAFDAVTSGNPDDWRAIQLAEGLSISFRPDTSGEPGKLEMRMRNNEEEAVTTAADGHEYVEGWTGEPSVRVRGPIATVWGEYEFWIDRAFSHCGVDAAALVKVDGEWKIANWMWTVEKEGCPTDPGTVE